LATAVQAGAAPPDPEVPEVHDCLDHAQIRSGGAVLHLSFDTREYAVGGQAVCAWMIRAATAVSGYFGRFPVPETSIELKPVDGSGVHGGSTYGEGPYTEVRLGRAVTEAELEDDWVMTHELVHLAVPSVPDASHWLEEGIATYVEPVARVQAGQLPAARIWSDMYRDMPKGLPQAGDRGLDRTPTWGRTYWGGALFCLLADVAIRERTGNRKGLQDALRGVLAAGGDIRRDWPVVKVLAAGDQATGTGVLGALYGEMGDKPGPDSLDELWRRLGVSTDGLSAGAPLATVRTAITTPH
jgi:hypothetical protein